MCVCVCVCVCRLMLSTCGTYMFTAGVVQSSGQDLGCSSPQCLPLPLGTEHVDLPLFFLRQRVAVTHLKERKKERKREREMSEVDKVKAHRG